MTQPSGPLAGIRVIDCGRYVAGPYCATLLGYLGADVIRVEKPGGGEDRFIAPIADSGEGGVFLQTGCNKRSLTLDLRQAAAREVLHRLVTTADVVVANLPPAALQSMGLDYPTLCSIRPDVILCTQTAFGTEGPWQDRGGFDGVGQVMSGAAYMSGTPGHPAKAAAPYVDFSTALMSAFGTLAALYERRTSGRGQHVQGTLLGTALAAFNSHLVEQGVLGFDRVPSGNRVQTSAPSDVFATSDGFILVHVIGKAMFARVARLVGAPQWIDAPGLQTDQQRGDRRDELCEHVARWCRGRDTERVLSELDAAGIPAGPVLNLRQALEHPQVAAMKFLAAVEFPGLPRPAPVADLPLRFSESGAGIRHRPPLLGEHSEELLRELGYSIEEIAGLRRRKVV